MKDYYKIYNLLNKDQNNEKYQKNLKEKIMNQIIKKKEKLSIEIK